MSRGQRFVGRETEFATLLDAVRAAASGSGGLALVIGEPGIGKTRLASEAARVATAESNAVVLWGRCPDAEGAPAFWPWRQIVRAAREAALAANELIDVEALLTQPLGSAEASPAQVRFELFERMASALRCVARHRPLLLILDDLHWADRSSVKLLQFLASEGRSSSLLFLATFREVEPSASPDVARLLGELAGLGLTVPLRGLTEAEVSELVADRAGVAPRPQLVRAVYEATHGNPFYVDEVVRLLVAERRLHDEGAEGAPLPIPMGVRAGISRRVDALGKPGAAVLGAAAVGGREIDLAVLARATGMSRDDLLGLLEAAERLGFVARARAIGSRFAFVHALVQETLYEGLSQGERAAWHHRIGEAIEALRARDLEPHLAELAHHFGRAAGGGAAATKAVEYGIRAGEASLRQLAFEKAEVELERSLASLDLLEGDTAAERCRIALGIAEARRGSGDVEGMIESFRQGIELARGLTPEIFAHAVLRLCTARHESFFVDQLVVGRLEEALERLPPGPSALRARCLARLGAALHLDPGSVERRSALTDEAIAIARSLGDRPTLAWVLMMRIIASLGPDNLEQRLALAGEIMRIADETGDSVARLEAETWRIHDLLELGDIEAVHLAIQSFARLAERLKQPVYLWHVATWRVMRALLEARLPEAESLLGDALVAGQRAQQQSALLRYGEGLLMLRYEQGRMRELEGLVRMGADQAPDVPTWRVAIASMHLENARRSEAQAELDRIAADEFRDLPRDANWLFAVVSLAHIACELGDRERARLVYDLLLPYAGRMTATRPAVSFSGGVSHFLGRLAALLGDASSARAHFDDALREHRQLGAVAWIARTETEYARFLLDHGEGDGAARAVALASAAHETAARLGLDEMRPHAEEVLARARASASEAAARLRAPPEGGPPANALLREGDFWRVVFQGAETRVRDLTGIRQIAELLRHPRQDISVLDLLGVSGRRASGGNSSDGPSSAFLRDAGEILDQRARAEYREELASLEGELEEARSFNDFERARTLEAEIAAISGELSRALGLGGRPRRAGAPIERARVSVTRTIRDAIRRLGALDPRLGRFLDESIRTGRFCSYHPALDRDLVWQVS